LCWQTVEQQFIPALAIASAVVCKLDPTTKSQQIVKISVDNWLAYSYMTLILTAKKATL
jgi:hypothetical protein